MKRPLPRRDGVLQNVAWLGIANGIARPLWFLFVTAACMRVLGVDGYGRMTAALALSGSVTILTDLGTSIYCTREAARYPERASALFTNLLLARGALAGLGVLLIGMYGVVGGGTSIAAFVWAGVYTLGYNLTEYCRSFFRAMEVLRFEAATLLAEKTLVIGLGLAGLLVWRTAAGTLGGMAFGIVCTLAVSAFLVHRRVAPFALGEVSVQTIRRAYRASLPIGVYSAATVLLLSTGAILLEALADDREVGIFGGAYRIVEFLLLLPTIVCTAFLPRLSILHHQGDRQPYVRTLWRSTLFISGGTIAVAAVMGGLAEVLFTFLAGEGFSASVPLLHALIWAYPFMGLTMLFSQVLVYTDDAWFPASVLVVTAVANGIFVASAVPHTGALGPALSLIAAHAIIAAICGWRAFRSAPALHP